MGGAGKHQPLGVTSSHLAKDTAEKGMPPYHWGGKIWREGGGGSRVRREDTGHEGSLLVTVSTAGGDSKPSQTDVFV